MNTKNWFTTLLGAGVVVSGLALTSCEDEFTEADAIAAQDSTLTALKRLENENAVALDELDHEQQMAFAMYQDSLERLGPVVNYTVTVVAGGSSNTNARTEGENFAEGATVTLVQGGVSRTATTSAGGVATFGDLRIGEAVVTVEAEDHTTVTYTTSLGDPSFDMQQDNVETMIPIFPLTVEKGASEVSGIAWAELDLTNNEPEFAEGAVVRGSISVAGALGSYGVSFGSSSKGEIRTASYTDFVVTDTVGADGRYSLVIPNGNADGGDGISADIEFLPYEAQQTYLAWQGDSLAVVTKAVIFESTGTSNDDDHLDYDLPSVWVEIGAPTGSASGFAVSPRAVAKDLNGGDVELDNRGTGYTVGDRFNFSADTAGNQAYIEVTAVDADNGAITGWTLVDDGAVDYTSTPTLTQDDAATGSGATYLMTTEFSYEFEVTNQGSGYWEEPDIIVTYSYYDNGVLIQDAYDDDMYSIDLLNGKLRPNNVDGIVYDVTSASVPTITLRPLEARQAYFDLDDFFVNDQGQIIGEDDDEYLYFSSGDADEGSGYLTAPTVTFKSVGDMGSGASGVAWVTGGEINYITITNPGSGYMREVNDFDYSISAPASQSASRTFKPSSTNANYNFNFGEGVIKQ